MFKTFPEFSKLSFGDRKEYEALIKDLPPVYDISFHGLMTWWNPLDNMSVAALNDNLVIPYWFAGDEKHSGLSLVGTASVDESICTIFDYLREKGDPVRLVNVPEFVVGKVEYPAMFNFKEERLYEEYVLPISNYYPIKNMTSYRRRKVERQLARAGEDSIVTRSLDLSLKKNRNLLWNATLEWQPKGINDYGKVEQDAIKACIENADIFGLDNVCLYVNDVLLGFCFYQRGQDSRYVIVKHIKATHVSALGFELIAYMFAKWFADRGISYVNVCADYGLLRLRMFMLTLGPANFFRKYRIEPR